MSCTISQVTSDQARQFWADQEDARIFLHPDVLEPLCAKVDWWLAAWNGNPVCLWPVCDGFDGSHRPPELSAYVGPMWHDSVARNKAHRWWTITREVQCALVFFLAERYTNFVFELPPGTRDIRVLQWLGSEVETAAEIVIECRHTAIARSPPQPLEAGLKASLSRDRMHDVRTSIARGYREWIDPDQHELFDLYLALLESKEDGEKALRRKRDVLGLVSLSRAGYGRVVAYCDAGGAPASFTLVLASKRTVQSVLLASTAQARRDGLQTFVRFQTMLRSFEDGAASFDFGGANSWVGAEEKHRYGAWPEMYFRIRVERR